MGPLPSGTVTFLFTDIEGSTLLWESAPNAMRAALERHDTLLAAAVQAHGGHVVKMTGDGLHAVFDRAGDALAAGVAMQTALVAEPWPDGAPIRVRMGVHTGEAAERDGDYFGTAVNRAARLMAVANGGQVLCSQSTAAVAGDGIDLRDLGEHRLRDLGAAEIVFQVGGGAFPSLRSVDAIPTNLPTVRSELVGRSEDLRALTELTGRERLVTLTGTGGVGKTRLALAVAAASTEAFGDGCWLVELAPVTDPAEVAKAAAAAMRAPAAVAGALVDYVADRRVLIVLDNCEHVLDAASDLVDEVLAAAPGVHVLATSREPLGLEGEHVRRVSSLAMPAHDATPAEARSSASVRLFADRAQAMSAGFEMDDSNVGSVVDICRHLDGIPLAIELAAARVRVMAPAEIAQRLDERFRLLAGGSRRSQERHRTLLATVSWSHDLLSAEERAVFRRLAVFPASFDLRAAEVVVNHGAADGVDGVDCVLRLVDRSLMTFEAASDRYRLLETLRQYAADRLAETDEAEAVGERHARYFLDLAADLAPAVRDSRYPVAHAVLSADLDNLRAVADWCADRGRWVDLLAMAQNMFFFIVDSAAIDGAAWYRLAIDHADALDPQAAVDALGELAWITVNSVTDLPGTIALAERSADLAEREGLLPPPYGAAARAMAAQYSGEPDAMRFCELAVEVAAARGDECAVAFAKGLAGVVLSGVDAEAGLALALEGFDHASGVEQQSVITSTLVCAASTYMASGAIKGFDAIAALLEEAPAIGHMDTVNAMWLDLMWLYAQLGSGESGAVRRLTRSAQMADRHQNPVAQDIALRLLAIAVGRTGRQSDAARLMGYCDEHLIDYSDTPWSEWIDEALEGVLADVPDRQVLEEAGAASSRTDIMTLVTEIERSLEQRASP